jgi:transcription antitermination factor NusG
MSERTEEKLQWRVLYTKPRAEKKALASLAKKGYVAYLPCTTVVKQWSDRKKKIQEPLFKSYLFVCCKAAQVSGAAADEAVVGVVRFDGRPAVVREEEMETIRRVEAGVKDVAVVDSSLATGQKVLIKGGALKGMAGTLTEFRGGQRVAVRIESLGCDLLLNVAAADVERQ